jgi:hypothetical protein
MRPAAVALAEALRLLEIRDAVRVHGAVITTRALSEAQARRVADALLTGVLAGELLRTTGAALYSVRHQGVGQVVEVSPGPERPRIITLAPVVPGRDTTWRVRPTEIRPATLRDIRQALGVRP